MLIQDGREDFDLYSSSIASSASSANSELASINVSADFAVHEVQKNKCEMFKQEMTQHQRISFSLMEGWKYFPVFRWLRDGQDKRDEVVEKGYLKVQQEINHMSIIKTVRKVEALLKVIGYTE